jgi:putative membrane protein
MPLSWLPPMNAVLNGTSAALLVTGLWFIKQGRREAHKRCMISALVVSTIFLVGYLTYHFQAGTTRFSGTGWVRTLYLSILGTHTVLAITVPPLAIATLVRALQERFDRHRRIARITFPIWLYVSVTGVVVYLMLRGDYPQSLSP